MIEQFRRSDVVAASVVTLIGVGVPLWLASASGQLGLPSNDDWVYMRGAQSLLLGHIEMQGHTAASIGQLILVQPLLWLSGGQPWAFPAFGAVMTAIALVATYLLARRFVGVGSAILVVLLVVAFPGFARQSVSFMTDGPAFALSELCLLFGMTWIDGGRRSALFVSLALGLVGISIRELAVAAPAAVLLVAWANSRPSDRRWLGITTVCFAASVGFVLFVAYSIGDRGIATTQAGPQRLILMGPLFTTFAAGLLPAIVLKIGGRKTSMTTKHVLAAVGLVVLVFLAFSGPFVGNLWLGDGALSNGLINGERGAVIPAVAWRVSEQLASFAGICLAAMAFAAVHAWSPRVRSRRSAIEGVIQLARRRESTVVIFLLATGLELITLAVLGGQAFDRYLYPILPAGAILLLWSGDDHRPLGRRDALAHGAFAWLAASAFLIAANSFAYDGARFRAGDAAVNMGYDAELVDAGYDWVGYHASTSSRSPEILEVGGAPLRLSWYYAVFPASPPCAILSSSQLTRPGLGLIQVDRSAYRQYLVFGPPQSLYLYGLDREGCPTPRVILGSQDQP